MPGKAELVAQRVHVGRDHAQVLGDDRQRAERRRDGVEERRPGPGTQRPCSAVGCAGRDLPVGLEAAEVVDAARMSTSAKRARRRAIHQA